MATNIIKQYIMKVLGINNILSSNRQLSLEIKELFQEIENLRKDQMVMKEILKSQIFHDLIVDSPWLIYKNFKPGGWAVDYGLLCTLFQVLNTIKPQNILEFGLGQSSKMIHQYAQYYHTEATTIEHDADWIKFFNANKEGEYSIRIRNLELETISYKGKETLSYKGIQTEFGYQKFDLIVVDAPFGSDHYSRSQILELSRNNLADTFCIIIDDCERDGEQETVKELESIFHQENIEFCIANYCSSKKHTIFCSKDYNFLTTL